MGAVPCYLVRDFSLVLGAPIVLVPTMRRRGIVANVFVIALVVAATVVALMGYVILPLDIGLVRQ